jgi:HK97 gp10 family phage protein
MKAGGGLRIEGLESMFRALAALPDKVKESLVGGVLSEAAKPIVAAAKAKVPVDTGELRASIHATTPRVRGGKINIQILPGAGFFHGDQYYAGFLEYGHYQGSRKLGDRRTFIPARPFLRPAADEQRGAAVSIVVTGLNSGLQGAFS